MLRKAIHLDAREERASIDRARAAASRRAARLNFLARSHVVSGPRLLRERERERERERPGPGPVGRDGTIIHVTSELANKSPRTTKRTRKRVAIASHRGVPLLFRGTATRKRDHRIIGEADRYPPSETQNRFGARSPMKRRLRPFLSFVSASQPRSIRNCVHTP